ncbi:MAG: roadblock/LC7 domain-containing protein [Magnetococcales bacterium]|nr:roadblock/LC7 domain-containing protein [Magnetococcales bacterium]
MSRVEKINEVLRAIRVNSPDVLGAVIVSIDGLPIASVAPAELDEELIAGMAAALLGSGEQISEELMGANMQQTLVRSEKGLIVLNAVSEDAVLVLLANKNAKLGLIFLEVRRAIRDLAAVI